MAKFRLSDLAAVGVDPEDIEKQEDYAWTRVLHELTKLIPDPFAQAPAINAIYRWAGIAAKTGILGNPQLFTREELEDTGVEWFNRTTG